MYTDYTTEKFTHTILVDMTPEQLSKIDLDEEELTALYSGAALNFGLIQIILKREYLCKKNMDETS